MLQDDFSIVELQQINAGRDSCIVNEADYLRSLLRYPFAISDMFC